jgi:hypothetical protein
MDSSSAHGSSDPWVFVIFVTDLWVTVFSAWTSVSQAVVF